MSNDQQEVTRAVKNWLKDIVIAENFCPFAKPVFEQESIAYIVSQQSELAIALAEMASQLEALDRDDKIATTLLIFDSGFSDFDNFLDLIELADRLIHELGYEGVYQLAHFHPGYCFDGCQEDDPENYTNRSPYPILHIIREASISEALELVKSPENIPSRNIRHARKLGTAQLADRLKNCQ